MFLICCVLVCQCAFCQIAVILLHRDINQQRIRKTGSLTSNRISINNSTSLLFYFLLRRKIFGPSPATSLSPIIKRGKVTVISLIISPKNLKTIISRIILRFKSDKLLPDQFSNKQDPVALLFNLNPAAFSKSTNFNIF